MNTRDVIRMGVPLGEPQRRAIDFITRFLLSGGDKSRLQEEVNAILKDPSAFTEDPLRGGLAKALMSSEPLPRAKPVRYRQWGEGWRKRPCCRWRRPACFR